MASILSIVYRPVDYGEERVDYIRVPLHQASLVAGKGIEGDKKGGKHPDRDLNILSQEWLESLSPRGYKTAPGQFGEQLILTGLDVNHLAPGARLKLGSQAIVEVVKARTGCNRFEAAQGKSMAGLGAMGVMARVIVGGPIMIGDLVEVGEIVSSEQ